MTYIYLPDNPLELIKMAVNVIGHFEDDLSNMEQNFILSTENGLTPEKMSLGAAVLWEEYENLDMYVINGRGLATSLIDGNLYYTSHLLFINAFVKDITFDMVDFLLPRCIVNIELFPSVYYISSSMTDGGYIEKVFSHSNLIESIQEYLHYYIRGMNKETQSGIDGLINRLIWAEDFAKKYLIYVPSKLE